MTAPEIKGYFRRTRVGRAWGFAAGVVLTYTTTGVFNFAHGAVGMITAFVFWQLTEGSGLPIPSRGDAALAISFEAQAYGELDGTDFRIFYGPHDADEVWDVSGFRAFRQVLWQGSFEGRTAMGLGVREELPFRVLVLDGPDDWTRLVVDIAHAP